MEEHGIEDRLDFLVKVLGLDGAQRAEVETILSHAHEQVKALLESIKSGSVDREAAREARPQIHKEVDAAIRDVLTPEQLELWEALGELHPTDHRFGPHGRRH
jgi:hypothetical protein